MEKLKKEVVLKNGKKALNNVKPILAKNIYEKTCARRYTFV